MDIGGFLGAAYIRQPGLRLIRSEDCLRGGTEGSLATNVGRPNFLTLVSRMGHHEPCVPRWFSIDFNAEPFRETVAFKVGVSPLKLVECSSHALVAVGRWAVFWVHLRKYCPIRLIRE